MVQLSALSCAVAFDEKVVGDMQLLARAASCPRFKRIGAASFWF